MPHCPCDEWKLILALARFGALRCPSELVALRWADIDLCGGTMTINATKRNIIRPAASGSAQSSRNCDRIYAADAFANPEIRWHRTVAAAIQNMRASRETELMARWPAKDVSSWLGNSTPVAMKPTRWPRMRPSKQPLILGVQR